MWYLGHSGEQLGLSDVVVIEEDCSRQTLVQNVVPHYVLAVHVYSVYSVIQEQSSKVF